MDELKRTCPNCGKELLYKSIDTFRNATKIGGLCRHCAGVKKTNTNTVRVGNLEVLLDESFETFY